MQKLPIAIVLATLVAAAAIAKTQIGGTQNPESGFSSPASRVSSSKHGFSAELDAALQEATRPYNEAWKEAQELYYAGDYKAAEKESRRALKLGLPLRKRNLLMGYYPIELGLLGDSQLARGHYKAALASYEGYRTPPTPIPGVQSVYSSYPDKRPLVAIRIAQCYAGLGDYKKAVRSYQQAMGYWPHLKERVPGAASMGSLKASLFYLRAQEEEAMTRFSSAVIHLQAAAKLAPTNPVIVYTLAKTLRDSSYFDRLHQHPTHRAEAVANYKRAAQLGVTLSYDEKNWVEMNDPQSAYNRNLTAQSQQSPR